MLLPRACLLLALTITAGCAGCELLTHAFDFRVAPVPPGELCAACPIPPAGPAGPAGLRHPPCPVSDPSPDLPRTFVYAARRSRLGHAVAPASPLFDLGFDLDCSDRPDRGRPVLCTPRDLTGWSSLPQGIDDALLSRILAPAYAAMPATRAVDLDAVVSGALEAGLYGVVVAVDDWNGGPDDPSVQVTLRTSPGLASGAEPAWTGRDTWAPYPDVDDSGYRAFAVDAQGYVAGGTLVVDVRSQGASLFRFGPRGADFEALVGDLTLTGALTPDRLGSFTVSGVIEQPSATAAAQALTAALAACPGGAAGYFFGGLPAMIAGAADMPFVAGTSASALCDGIPFAWALDAEPALLAEEPAGGEGDGGCP